MIVNQLFCLNIIKQSFIVKNTLFNLIKKNIIDRNYEYIYNYKTNDYISINKCNIIDPADVIIYAFKNALSIAAMLLSTSSLVINIEEKDEINNM